MYTGSTMCFAGLALTECSAAGLLLTLLVHVMYKVGGQPARARRHAGPASGPDARAHTQLAEAFEGPFTAKIYAERDSARKAKAA